MPKPQTAKAKQISELEKRRHELCLDLEVKKALLVDMQTDVSEVGSAVSLLDDQVNYHGYKTRGFRL